MKEADLGTPGTGPAGRALLPAAIAVAGLVVAALPWLYRDRSWIASPADAFVPWLGAAMLFAWARPLQLRPAPLWPRPLLWALPATLLAVGAVTGFTLAGVAGWTSLAILLGRALLERPGASPRQVAACLPFLFPWAATELPALGNAFRIGAAEVVAATFSGLGFAVEHRGVEVVIDGVAISVEPACSGLQLLHVLLLVGALGLLARRLPDARFFLGLAFLPLLAFLANTFRVVVVTAAALTAGIPFASGLFHEAGGLIAIVGLLLVASPLVALLHGRPARPDPPSP